MSKPFYTVTKPIEDNPLCSWDSFAIGTWFEYGDGESGIVWVKTELGCFSANGYRLHTSRELPAFRALPVGTTITIPILRTASLRMAS